MFFRIANVTLMGCFFLFPNCAEAPQQRSATSRSAEVDAPSHLPEDWFHMQVEEIPLKANDQGQPELTRNFYFILDGSGSMGEKTDKSCGGEQKFTNKMVGAQWAVKEFLKHVPEDVNIGLYVFDEEGKRETVALGRENRDEFVRAVERMRVGGGTPLREAIVFGTQRLVEQYRRQLGYGEYRLVVVTDGQAKGIPAAAMGAAKVGIPLYSIGLCVGADHPLRLYSVSYREADRFSDLASGLQQTLAELPQFDVTQFD